MEITAGKIAELVNGSVEGNPEAKVNGPSKIDEDKPGTISFLANPKYEQFIYDSNASVVLVNRSFSPSKNVAPTLIRVDDVYSAIGVLLQHYDDGMDKPEGIHSSAVVSDSADIAEGVGIGSHSAVMQNVKLEKGVKICANVYIGYNCHIGENTVIHPGAVIYQKTVIGKNCVIHANAVIGSEGFGYSKDSKGRYSKVSHVGNVIIEDDVEIGAHTAIDRGTMGSTRICRGAKLDNLIQVAHNVIIGEDTAIAAQTGISGSVKIGRRVIVGGQAGFSGHLEIADDVQIQAQSGIAGPIKEKGAKLYGSPAIEYKQYLRSYAAFKQLPDIMERIKTLERELKNYKREEE